MLVAHFVKPNVGYYGIAHFATCCLSTVSTVLGTLPTNVTTADP